MNHHKFMEAQTRLGLTTVELVQLSSTHWACQLRSISAVLETLSAILEFLFAIGSPIAVCLRAKLYKFSTAYAVLMFQSLLSVTKGLHKLYVTHLKANAQVHLPWSCIREQSPVPHPQYP